MVFVFEDIGLNVNTPALCQEYVQVESFIA